MTTTTDCVVCEAPLGPGEASIHVPLCLAIERGLRVPPELRTRPKPSERASCPQCRGAWPYRVRCGTCEGTGWVEV